MTVQPETVLRLTKVTLNYHKVEDRIRMDGRAQQGDTVALWLTRRLCRELVKTVVAYFNRPEVHSAEIDRAAVSPQHVDAVQEFLHQKAKSNRKISPPVVSTASLASAAVLVDRVQVRTSAKVVQISFPLGEASVAVMAMTPTETRQWLDVLYQQCRLADWSLDIWPQWIQPLSATDTVNPEPRGKVH